MCVKPFNVLKQNRLHQPHRVIPEESQPWKGWQMDQQKVDEVLQDVNNPGLLELAACVGPQVLFQHFVLEGSQSRLEDRRSGPFPCLLHFSPFGERQKPVCHVDEEEEEMRDQ